MLCGRLPQGACRQARRPGRPLKTERSQATSRGEHPIDHLVAGPSSVSVHLDKAGHPARRRLACQRTGGNAGGLS
jgi:hypothetical protein